MRHVRTIAAGLLLLQTLLLGWMANVQSPVLDELPHLASGIAHWEFGTFELYRVNPPLVRMIAALPVMAAGVETDWMGGWPDDPYGRPEFPLGRRLVSANGERTFWIFTLARWACLPFAWLGGWICFRWARELYGDLAGLTALGFWCICPNVLAWGATICPDLPAAATGVAAGYTYWRWLKQPDWASFAVAGLCLGIALLTKSTWIVLIGLWPLLWMAWRLRVSHDRRPTFCGLAGIVLLGLYVVHVGYGFAGALRPLGEFTFISRSLTGHSEHGEPGNRFRGTWLATIPAPLPADYVSGIDVQRYDFEKGKWSYLRGEQKLGGWWWWYLYAFGVKTPVGTLLVLLIALLTCWQRRGVACRADEMVVLLPALVVIALVSSQTGFNRYLRYLLPAVPFVFVWISRVVASAASATSRWRLGLVATCLIAAAASSLSVWPHSLAYFNRLAGGPENGHRHLLDANLDWGQGLLALKQWVDKQPQVKPLYLSDFGWVEPQLAGIEAQPVPRLLWRDDGRLYEGKLDEVVPGWYVASVNHVMGYRHYETDRPAYTWLQEFTPIARPGYAYWVYHLTEPDVRAFVARHGKPDAATLQGVNQ